MRQHRSVRVVGALVSAVSGALWLLFVYTVLRSHVGGPAHDPHGYALIFGTVLALPAGFVCALSLPWAFPPQRSSTVLSISMCVYLAVSAVLVLAWISNS